MQTRGLVLAAVLIASLTVFSAQAQLPQTLDEMKAQHVLLGVTPEGAVEAFVGACFVYMQPGTRDAGREMLQYLALPLGAETSWDRLPSQRLFREFLAEVDRHHVWRSYVKGATPENGYRMDPEDWELDVQRARADEDDARGVPVQVRSSGADGPRTVYLMQDQGSGLWFVNAWDELLQDVRPPMAER